MKLIEHIIFSILTFVIVFFICLGDEIISLFKHLIYKLKK